jgi:hypothetical protein
MTTDNPEAQEKQDLGEGQGFTKLSVITEKETMEFFTQGLRKAASAAKELAKLQENFIWADISILLNELHNSGVTLATSKALKRTEVLTMIGDRQKTLEKQTNASRVPSSKKFIIN